MTLVVCAIVGYRSDKASLIDNTLDLNRINADKLARTADDLLASSVKALGAAAGHLAEDPGSEVQFDLDLVKQSNNVFNSVFMADDRGVVSASSPEGIGVVGKTLTSEAARQALEQRKPLISEPYIGITNRYIILVSVPIFGRDGAYRGFLAGSIYLNESNVFETMLGTQSNSISGSYIYVVSDRGELLYHPDKNRIGETVLLSDAVRRVVQGEQGAQRVLNSQGADMLAGFAPVPEARWGIISQTPASAVLQSANKLVGKIFLYSVPLLFLLSVLAVVLIRYISGPLYKLASTAERLDTSASFRMPKIHRWNYEANELYKTMSKAVAGMRNQIAALSEEAQKDTLTGLNNRRTMDRIVNRWIETNVSFCYLILDIDRFKAVNDTYGHQTGDEVLKFVARKLTELAGDEGICCRYGGEEFAVLAPTGDLDEACSLAERIRRGIENEASPTGKPMTISAGVASIADHPGDPERMMQMADEALYRSKHAGRNRVSRG